jgi:hypothetical protein
MFVTDSAFNPQVVVSQQSNYLWGKLSQELNHLGSQIFQLK